MSILLRFGIAFALAALVAAAGQSRIQISPTAVIVHQRRPVGTPARARLVAERRLALRRETIKMRIADGGTLTPAHRAYLQTRFDEIDGGLATGGR